MTENMGNFFALVFTILVTFVVKAAGLFFIFTGLKMLGLVQGTISFSACAIAGIGAALIALDSTVRYEPKE